MICDEAHTALGEKTSAAIRSFPEPVFIGMTATEQLIAKQVSDVFPASVDDLPLADAARRGLIAPLRCLRVPPAAAINSVPIVGGDFDQEALAKVLDHVALNQAAASLYRERFDSTPGIVYAAGVDHAYNLAQEFRAAGLKAEAVSGRTPPVKLAEILAAYERGEIDVLVNAMLLAEGWNSPRATVVMHLAPTARRRVYQQRIGRIMRLHPRKEAGVVVDFVQKGATHTDRVVTLHSLLGADFYREGARVTPAPRRRVQRRARRKLDAGTVARPGHARRQPPPRRDPARVAARRPALPRRGGAAVLGAHRRPAGPLRRPRRALREAHRPREQGRARAVPLHLRRREPEPAAAADGARRPGRDDRRPRRASTTSSPSSTQAPPWEKDRVQGVRILLRAIGEGRPDAPDQILARWTWRLARAVRKVLDRKASAEYPEAKRLLGALANSRGHRHEENARETRQRRREELPIATARRAARLGRGLHAARERRLDDAREELGTISEVANALADDLPAPKAHPGRRRRRRRKKKRPGGTGRAGRPTPNGNEPAPRRPDGPVTTEQAAERPNKRAWCSQSSSRSWQAWSRRSRRASCPSCRSCSPAASARTGAARSRSSPASRSRFFVSIALRDLDPRQARPAEGPAPQHLDRAAVPDRGRARRPAGRHVDRAAAVAPLAPPARRPRRRLRARLRLGFVFVPCAGPALAYVTASAATGDFGLKAILVDARVHVGVSIACSRSRSAAARVSRRLRPRASASGSPSARHRRSPRSRSCSTSTTTSRGSSPAYTQSLQKPSGRATPPSAARERRRAAGEAARRDRQPGTALPDYGPAPGLRRHRRLVQQRRR